VRLATDLAPTYETTDVLGGLAELERSLIRPERVKVRARAVDQGIKFGRKSKLTALKSLKQKLGEWRGRSGVTK
jgi:hypothetical protein